MRWPPPSDWLNKDLSRQVFCKPHRWHVQETGSGPTILLIHGAGGSSHSFRDVIPLLAEQFRVVAIDLPGQGLTQLGARHRSGLDPMAQDIVRLAAQERWHPELVIGHSAGGAVALRLAQHLPSVRQMIGINPALGNFEGVAGILFPAMAKLLALTPGAATFFSRSAHSPDRVRSLIESTGTRLSPEGLAYYRRLVGDPGHVDATLLMMAQWSLTDLLRDLPQISTPCLFMAADRDEAVPPSVSERAARRLPDASVLRLNDLGHLAHEEDPRQIADHIARSYDRLDRIATLADLS